MKMQQSMEARTYLLWFQLDNNQMTTKREDISSRVESLPSIFLSGQWTSIKQSIGENELIYSCLNSDGSFATMRMYPSGFLTFDLQYQIGATTKDNALQMLKDRMHRMKEHLGSVCTHVNCHKFPIVRSFDRPCPYTVKADERLAHLDITGLVYEFDSPWQNIKVYKSQQCGNVLCLDDHVMTGESDLLYTETLLRIHDNDYRGKNILILGGGDGAALHELVTRCNPGFVTLIDIDEEVPKACRKHMRSVCGNMFDRFDNKNHKIVIGNCVDFLEEAVAQNKTFDYIVNDLTEFPVGGQVAEFDYEITRVTLRLGFQVLSRGGTYVAKAKSISESDFKLQLEKYLEGLDLDFSVQSAHVPSFHKECSFLQIWRRNDVNGNSSTPSNVNEYYSCSGPISHCNMDNCSRKDLQSCSEPISDFAPVNHSIMEKC